jgi:hypothetical protein
MASARNQHSTAPARQERSSMVTGRRTWCSHWYSSAPSRSESCIYSRYRPCSRSCSTGCRGSRSAGPPPVRACACVSLCDAACVRACVSTNLAVGLALFAARKALVALRNGCLVLCINPGPAVFARPTHHPYRKNRNTDEHP